MKCPVCADVALSISSREGVEIDFCPECRGVWLDRGELDKIIERAGPAGNAPVREPEAPRRTYDERAHDRDRDRDYDRGRDYDKRRRKRSFLEDIFDFD